MSQWMVSLDKLSEEQRQFIDEEIPLIQWKHFVQIRQELEKLDFDIRAKKLTLKDYQFHFNKYCKKPSLLVQGYEFKDILHSIVHSIYSLKIKKDSIKIAILVPNKLLISMINKIFRELNIKNIEITHYFNFVQNNLKANYDYIFVIEIRELTYKMVRSIQSKSKILVCTDTQSLVPYDKTNPYTKEPIISSGEIDILNANSWILTTIDRLPKSLIKLVSIFMPSMGILSSKTDLTNKDIRPNLAKGSSKEKEVEYILSNAKTKISIGENAVIILASKEEVIGFINLSLLQNNMSIWEKSSLNGLNEYLESSKSQIVYVGNGNSELLSSYMENAKVVIISYKNSKFLSFENAYLPFLSDKSDIKHKQSLIRECNNSLTFTYSGEMHEYLKLIENECNKIDIDNVLNKSSSDFDDDFDF